MLVFFNSLNQSPIRIGYEDVQDPRLWRNNKNLSEFDERFRIQVETTRTGIHQKSICTNWNIRNLNITQKQEERSNNEQRCGQCFWTLSEWRLKHLDDCTVKTSIGSFHYNIWFPLRVARIRALFSRLESEEMRQKLEEERQDHNKPKDDDKAALWQPWFCQQMNQNNGDVMGYGDSIGRQWDKMEWN